MLWILIIVCVAVSVRALVRAGDAMFDLENAIILGLVLGFVVLVCAISLAVFGYDASIGLAGFRANADTVCAAVPASVAARYGGAEVGTLFAGRVDNAGQSAAVTASIQQCAAKVGEYNGRVARLNYWKALGWKGILGFHYLVPDGLERMGVQEFRQ